MNQKNPTVTHNSKTSIRPLSQTSMLNKTLKALSQECPRYGRSERFPSKKFDCGKAKPKDFQTQELIRTSVSSASVYLPPF